MAGRLDGLDVDVLRLLETEPRISVLEISRRLSVARNTVQARLDRLARLGIVTGFGPDVDLAALGYGVIAFVTLELDQAAVPLSVVESGLRAVPEVLEVVETTGSADVWCRVAARDNAHLAAVVQRILRVRGVLRSATAVGMLRLVDYRTAPLLAAAAGLQPHSTRSSGQ